MNFQSINFILFFGLIFLTYFLIPRRFQWMLLLVASYWFYAQWNAVYLFLIIFTSASAYVTGLLLCRLKRPKVLLTCGIILCLIPMIVFKYSAFLAAAFNDTISIFLNPGFELKPPSFLLPVGISFYTFQAIAYMVDVYRKPSSVEKHPGIFALFISFFPQLVAGPIERAANILPELRKHHFFCRERASSGARLFLWGLFKKLIIADHIAVLIKPVFSNPQDYNGVAFILAGMGFGIQIYCDFSAYSDIAIGTARILGINLMRNFRNPYMASSFREFWQRWHISLSTWFRDYIYVPLGGNRSTALRCSINLLIVFVVSGLWHGAAWTFVIWGAMHGIGLVLERSFIQSRRPVSFKFIRIFFVFTIISVMWIPFRCSSLTDTWYMLSNLHQGWSGLFSGALSDGGITQIITTRMSDLVITLAGISVLIVVECMLWPSGFVSFRKPPKLIRWAAYLFLTEGILLFGVHHGSNPFIYFQF